MSRKIVMSTLHFQQATWPEIEPHWQSLLRDAFHSAYMGIGEAYAGLTNADDKIRAMAGYIKELPIWAVWFNNALVGLLVARQQADRLVIYDLLVASDMRQKGIAKRLVQLAMIDSQARTVVAEVNASNTASLALFHTLGFQPQFSSTWLEWQQPSRSKSR